MSDAALVVFAHSITLRLRRMHVDRSLVAGSALFGVGWATAGMCPGPALANFVLPLFGVNTAASVAPFCASMALGMRLVDALEARGKGKDTGKGTDGKQEGAAEGKDEGKAS